MNNLVNNLFSVEEKIVIITGTSRGIGYALAEGFLKCGSLVHGISRSGSDLIKYENYSDHRINIKDKLLLKNHISAIHGSHGSIDSLINCAGISIPTSVDNAENIFRETFEINLFAAFNLCSEVIKIMKKKKSGSIINVTSIGANFGFPSNPGYISSKSSLSGLTRSLSYDYSQFGIRVNNLVPGYFLTDMTKESHLNEKKRNQRSSRTILRRWGNPKELIGPAIFLASNASSYMTGVDLVVDGGWSIKGL